MRTPWRILAISLCIVLGLTARVPQGIFSDQASQLRAVRQFVAGQSPTLNSVIEPDLRDLSRDRTIWIISRPPATQLAMYPWLAAGLSPGLTVRILAILCLILGSAGWLRWYERFDMPRWVHYGVAGALPFLHEASNSLYTFSQDTLSYAVAPWVLLLALSSQRRRGLVVGLVLGFTYIIKYSLFFLGFGALAWLLSRRRDPWLTVGFAIPLVALSVLNAHYGPAVNSFAALAGFYPRWGSLVALIANPAMAVADAEGLIRTGLQTGSQFLPAYIALAPGLAFLWLTARGARLPEVRALDAAQLALVVFVTTLIVMVVVWTFSDYAADTTARHVAAASLAVLPVVVLGAAQVWRRHGLPIRAAVAGLALVVIVGPLLYGALALVAKAGRVPRTYHLGPSALLNPYLATWPALPDLASVEHNIIDQFGPVTDVWYCDYPIAPLDLPGRVWGDVDERYVPPVFRSSKPLRVTALILTRDETHGGGTAIRARFQGAGPWTRTVIPGANVSAWTTTLEPTGP
jgi:hypothetical protein